jgi:Tol biopolymer transport system component
VRLFALVGVLVAVLVAAPAAVAASRAYELVSPADKGNSDVLSELEGGSFFLPLVSPDGEAAAFTAPNAFPGSVSDGALNVYSAARGAEGWATTALSPPIDPVFSLSTSVFYDLSSDLRRGVFIGNPEPPLTADAAPGTGNLYLREADGSVRLLTVGAPDHSPEFTPEFEGAAGDDSHVFFVTNNGELETGTPAGIASPLYDWSADSGEVSLVGRLPNGELATEAVNIAIAPGENVAGNAGAEIRNAVSADGSRVFFYTPYGTSQQQLYVRIDGSSTKQPSLSRRTTPDPKGPKPAQFQFAAQDGSGVFFTSAQKLTDDANTGTNDTGADLYRYDVATEALTDVTVDVADAAGAQVRGVLGGAADGSSLYFVAKGVLGAGAVAGSDNLYRWHDDGSAKGAISLVAVGAPEANWAPTPQTSSKLPSRVTPDGEHLAFVSTTSLTGYPNAGHLEAYLYDAGSEQLRCATCNPEGFAATADAIPVGSGDLVQSARTLTDDGSAFFFSSAERLGQGDVNDAIDAYEYDAETEQVNLISSGQGAAPSLFADASADGRDVLFTTRERLVGIDQDENYDAYDARVGGGIAAQNPPAPPPPCEATDTCRVLTPPPAVTPPATSTFQGPGNRKPHRRHKRKHAHKHKKHHTRPANRHAQG